jgi:Ca2+-binding EF-hand superfamily protein
MFAEFDTSGDNKIDIDEFVTIMSNGAQVNFNDEVNVKTIKNINGLGKL